MMPASKQINPRIPATRPGRIVSRISNTAPTMSRTTISSTKRSLQKRQRASQVESRWPRGGQGAASSSPSSPREERAGRGPRRGETNKNAPPLPGPLLHPMEEREKSRSLMRPWNGTACVEFHLLTRSADDPDSDGAGEGEDRNELVDLDAAEREARLVALRLLELKQAGHGVWDDEARRIRPVTWSDMVVLLRSPRSKVEAFAREFSRAGLPLQAARGGFFDALEIMDLLNLLKLLDNPLQDVPLLAVLHSPLVGLTLEELAEIRAQSREKPFWITLQRFHRGGRRGDDSAASAWDKVDLFLRLFAG